jgi:cystathionine beta-lyase/cystathionine gamma-synthase
MTDRKPRMATKLVHAGEPRPRPYGAVNVPVFLSSTYAYQGPGHGEELRYIRYNNTPNQAVLHDKLAALENAEDALVTASGMAAISSVLFALLEPGDHVLAQNVLYGGTHQLMTRDLPKLGIGVDLVPGDDPDAWRARLRPRTKAIYVESIANPLLDVPDPLGTVRFAREHGLVSVIDNTFATPVFFRPAEHGFDLSIHSATKYLNGHSDIVAGAVIGRRDLVARTMGRVRAFGGSLDPHACYLLYRGLRTLELRVRAQSATAAKLATFFDGHPAIARTWYPGLAGAAGHARAAELFDGFGGMVSFELKDASRIDAFLERLTLAFVAPSLGGTETLVSLPARTSHAGLSADERRAAGISDALVRVSVGIEDADDLIADFGNALG